MSRERNRGWTRRRLLAVGGAAATGGVAGCTGGGESDDDAANRETTANRATTTDPPLDGHPAAVGVGDQPRFGPPSTDAEGVVVAFEDPSCPRCAAFETETVPELRERLGDRISFVFRGYPVVYPWGEPAAQTIEAAFAREVEAMSETGMGDETTAETGMDDESIEEDASYGSDQGSVASWALIRHYFENHRLRRGQRPRPDPRVPRGRDRTRRGCGTRERPLPVRGRGNRVSAPARWDRVLPTGAGRPPAVHLLGRPRNARWRDSGLSYLNSGRTCSP